MFLRVAFSGDSPRLGSASGQGGLSPQSSQHSIRRCLCLPESITHFFPDRTLLAHPFRRDPPCPNQHTPPFRHCDIFREPKGAKEPHGMLECRPHLFFSIAATTITVATNNNNTTNTCKALTLLSDGHSFKCFMYISSFNTHNNPKKQITVLSLFYRRVGN